jgi:broad specificity phosphatase PhoE
MSLSDVHLVMVRHGESQDDVEGRFGGLCNLGLSDVGRVQASEASKALASESVAAVFVSPLARASEFADILQAEGAADRHSFSIIHSLHERNSYGVLTGHPKADIKRLFGGFLEDDPSSKSGFKEPIPGSESIADFESRVERAWIEVIEIARQRDVQRFALVSHRNFFNSLAKLLRLTDFTSMAHGEVRSYDIRVKN